ncbi:MAG: rod shape-determining protein MreC [Treponema sp.]|nr:rod shape-determining protein MreC [Treponema sp.]
MRLGGEKSKGSRRGVELYTFAVLTLVSFSSLFFSSRGNLAEFQNVGLTMFSGIRGAINEIFSVVSNTVFSVQELTVLRREHSELLEQIARYQQLERTAVEVWQENARLREQLGFAQAMSHQHIPARLIGRDPSNLFSAFVINRGTRAGVTPNMPVVAFHGGTQGLVGKVIHSGAFESLVMPLYDSRGFVAARLAQSRYEGILEGQGSPRAPLLMRYIINRARDEVSIGDMVITSGLGGVYPPEINIGRVTRIIFEEAELSMEVEVEPVIDFFRLEYVFVISDMLEGTVAFNAAEGESDG